MQFIKSETKIDFVGLRKFAITFSLALILVSIISLIVHKGPNYGIDFAGGTLIQVKMDAKVEIDAIKRGLKQLNLDGISVQTFGDEQDNEYLIRTNQSEETSAEDTDKDLAPKLKSALEASTNQKAEIRRIEMVGPQVGKDLREKALFALFYALLFITIYISGRFEQKWALSAIVAAALILVIYVFTLFHVSIPILITVAVVITLVIFWFLQLKYAMGAIVALLHDVMITVGIFSLLNMEFTLPIIAALLTIVGYSLNDTIIVFDRIRDNIKKHQKQDLDEVINRSINETLSRTILTSFTTLLVLICLFLLGGGIIHDFSFAMLVGVLIGTYSSIFVASPILMAWQQAKTA